MRFNVTTAMTKDAIQHMSLTMNHNRKRNVRRTSEKLVSLNMKQLHSMKQSRFAELHLSKTVMFRVLRSVLLNMSQSVGQKMRNMMSLMMWWIVKLLWRKNVQMKLQDTQQTPSVQNGPRRCAAFHKRMSKSSLQLRLVPRNPGNCVPQQDADLKREERNVLIRLRQLCRMPQRRSAPWSPKGHVIILPNLFPS